MSPPRYGDGVPVTIVLADDHAVVRSGLRLLIEAHDGWEVVAEAGDVDAAARSVLGHRPDLLVLDLTMPGGPSIDALPRIFAASAATKVVVLTMQEDPEYARRALAAGAHGYVLKDAADTELVRALDAVLAGQTYLHPSLGARIATMPDRPAGPPGGLSPREAEVLRLIALGHTNAEIAGLLHLSVRTVETHRAHIQQKLGAGTRAELVRFALDNGLVMEGGS